MAVNPDDLLIFKLRKTAGSRQAKEAAPAAAVPEARPAAAQQKVRAPAAPPAPPSKEAAVRPEEVPKEAEQPRVGWQEREEGYVPEGRKEMPFPQTANAAAEASGTREHIISYLAGAVFLASAAIFGYLIYTPSLFVISDIMKIGLDQFMNSILLNSISYEYEISMLNIALVAFSALSGVLMFARPEKVHRFGGIVVALVILAVTYEYLNTNSGDLLIVMIAAFFEMGILVYASMAASNQAIEENEIRTEDIAWPRIEAF